MNSFRDFVGQEAKERNQLQTTQNNAIEATQNQLDRLLDMASRDLLDDQEYQEKKQVLKADLKRLQEEQAGISYRG